MPDTTPTEPIDEDLVRKLRIFPPDAFIDDDDRERYLVIPIGDHYAIVVKEEE